MIRVWPVCALLTMAIQVWAESCDLERGQNRYQKCVMCHGPITESVPHGVGPSLFDVVGREAGSAPGFAYSLDMIESGLLWDSETLDAYLAAPNQLVPGTSMAFRGVRNDTDRRALVCYIVNKGMLE